MSKTEFVHEYMNNINVSMDKIYDKYSLYNHNLVRECNYDYDKRELTITFAWRALEGNDIMCNVTEFFKTIKTKNITFTGIIQQLTEEQLTYFPQIIHNE